VPIDKIQHFISPIAARTSDFRLMEFEIAGFYKVHCADFPLSKFFRLAFFSALGAGTYAVDSPEFKDYGVFTIHESIHCEPLEGIVIIKKGTEIACSHTILLYSTAFKSGSLPFWGRLIPKTGNVKYLIVEGTLF